MTPSLSLIVPTRERATYLAHALRTCTANPQPDLEIVVLDNASTDGTSAVLSSIADPRVRRLRSDSRLSMRDNFEKGLDVSRGEIVAFIGDDDGVLPFTVASVLDIFHQHDVQAVVSARANYFWPDLLSGRRNMALLPRWQGVEVLDSRIELRRLLTHGDYYRLPCLYHGFVRRSVVDQIRSRQGRFFLANQVDMFSSVALSMEGIRYAFSRSPLVINGASPRSNGASHFGGGAPALEKQLWKQEGDLGFLPGFDEAITIPALIVESALRYCAARPNLPLVDVFEPSSLRQTLTTEAAARISSGRLDDWQQMFQTAGLDPSGVEPKSAPKKRRSLATLARAFVRAKPIDMDREGVSDVAGASFCLAKLLEKRRFGLAGKPWIELAAARRLRNT
jgi:glycosyltransferase involved in cell wall biosynthesis